MQINQKRSPQHVYDYVIIGAGLSGLSIATALSRTNTNVALIEAAETYGGTNKPVPSLLGNIDNGLRFLPDSDLAKKALTFLGNNVGKAIAYTSTENSLTTFESGNLRPFIGFGAHPPPFYDELSYFLAANRFILSQNAHHWPELLYNNYRGDFLPKSYATKFQCDESESDLQITSVVINGQKTIRAHNFIYCGPILDLQGLLPEASLSTKARQKLSKATFWTALCLDVIHSKNITDSSSLHILNGTTKDELGPCIGHFYPAASMNSDTLQLSQWLSFLDNENAEDSENVGNALKKIKRQIKRAYPDAFDNIKSERIFVAPSVGGSGDLKLNSNQTLPAHRNLWIGSGSMNPQKNILGSLLQAELITSALGCHPEDLQVEVIENFTAEAQEPLTAEASPSSENTLEEDTISPLSF